MSIITISRQMGTGAYQIASDVARELKYTLVDAELIRSRAQKHGLSSEMFEMVDEKPPSFDTVENRKRAAALNTLELILLDFARKGNVVLYGRGCQYLLRDCGNVLKVRIVADSEDRMSRFAEREWIDPDLANSIIRLNDYQREGFISFCFNASWDDPLAYDIVFNMTRLSQKSVVNSIVVAAKEPRLKQTEADAAEFIDNTILTNRIKIALLDAEECDYRPFRISSVKGRVYLNGCLSSEEAKNTVLKIVKSVKGVREIKEEIQVVNYDLYKDKS